MGYLVNRHIETGLRCFSLSREKKQASWLSDYRIKLTAIVMLSVVFSGASAQTHCKAGEELVFSCKIAKSRKVVSLCATSKIIKGKKSAITLLYRFGKLNGTPEFQFPSSETGSLKQFKLYEYLRPDLISTSISFSNGAFDYVVNESEDQRGALIKLAGIAVSSRANNKELDLACETESIYSDWSIISGVVPCEEGATLNACEYK
ncbi:MAG: hypothetical protein HYU74_11695 [Dechloromonas sp.]|nr:hypothetical protein [Dechloromonas sp.]